MVGQLCQNGLNNAQNNTVIFFIFTLTSFAPVCELTHFILMSLSFSSDCSRPHYSHLFPQAAIAPSKKKCQHLLSCDSFGLRSMVTCHNSGKSLWLDLQVNNWHGMVDWQKLRLTLRTHSQQNLNIMIMWWFYPRAQRHLELNFVKGQARWTDVAKTTEASVSEIYLCFCYHAN